jgi:hypothetical protein
MIDLSQEIRVLNTTAELIESSVNHMVCTFLKNEADIVTEVKPKNLIEKKYFYILFLEIISPVNREMIPGKEQGDTLLTIVRRICENPILSNEADTKRLAVRSQEFIDWLALEISYKLYSANLGKDVNVMISRNDILYLVGNRCKHTLVRSNRIMSKLAQKYHESGVDTENGAKALILEDIDNWFFDDFCGYHFTKLCELCSNLYHSIIEYVRPEFDKRLVQKDEIMYSYKMPPSLTCFDQKSEFYELFNRVRNVWVPVIQTLDILTKRY